MNKNIMRILCTLFLATLLAACERRPLQDSTNMLRVRVVLKVSDVNNVTTNIYNSRIPAPSISPSILRVIFYDEVTDNVASQGFLTNKETDTDGNTVFTGYVNVPAGKYNLVCYNFDTPSLLVENEDNWNTINAYTSEVNDYFYTRFYSSRAENDITVIPRIYYEPDHLIVARENGVVIPKRSELVTIHTEAKSIIDTYYIQVRLVNGQYASDATAILTDLAPSNKFAIDERKHDEYSATFFEMHRSNDPRIRANNQDVLCATFNTFGKRPDEIDPSVESKLYVTFNVITVDGQKAEMTVDMDSIFKTEPAIEKHWLLIDKEFVIPEPKPDPDRPDEDKGMFETDVEGWDNEEGYIDI